MKHLVFSFCFVPLLSFSQYWDYDRIQPLYAKYQPDSLLKNKVSSISKRKVLMLGDSITRNIILEQVFFGTDGLATRQISWNEWTPEQDSSIVDFNSYQAKMFTQKRGCNTKNKPALLKLTEITGVAYLPYEFEEQISFMGMGDLKMEKSIENDKLIEFVSLDDLGHAIGYFYPQSNDPNDGNDSLDPRTIIRIDLQNKRVEFQTTGISNPPTNVPQTAYHRTVYHYNFSMQLLWKDEYQANLSYYNFTKDYSEYKVSRTVYDYDQKGMLKREITFLEENPYSLKDYGLYIQQIQYEITYRE